MKKLSVILFFIPIICFGQIKPDKYYHAGVGAGISVSSHLIFKGENVNPIKGTLLTTPFAFGKELHDSFNGGKFSGQDIAFTLISAAIIDLSILGIKRIFRKKKNRFVYVRN